MSPLDAKREARLDHPEQDAARAHALAPMPSGCRPTWHVVATKPKAETRAAASLHLKGYTAYLPLLTAQRTNRSWHTGPLFPGYLFLQLTQNKPWYPIRYAPGVFQLILTSDGLPAICPEAAVEALRAAEPLRSATTLAGRSIPAAGDAFRVRHGPARGIRCVVISVRRDQARVSMLFLGQLRDAWLPLDALAPVVVE